METVADRYRRLSKTFLALADGVPDDGWERPTPCPAWTSRELMGHVVETQGMFEGLVGRTLEPGPDVLLDPVGAVRSATKQVQAHLDDPVSADVAFEGYFGPTTFAESVDGFLCFDFIMHRWDLARATGQDERIPAQDRAWTWDRARSLGAAIRSPSVCGPEVSVADDASDQDRLLGFLGRQP